MLTFSEERHEYKWDDIIVPSVTQLLHDLTDYTTIPAAKLEIARQRGMAVHQMVEWWSKGMLGEREDQPEWMQPVYDRWLEFVDRTGFKVLLSETRMYHRSMKFAGTPDIIGTMNRQRHAGVLDLKRSFFAGPVIALQTAGYEILAQEGPEFGQKIGWRAALTLNERGEPRLQMYDDQSDTATFMACVVLHRFKQRHGLLEKKK